MLISNGAAVSRKRARPADASTEPHAAETPLSAQPPSKRMAPSEGEAAYAASLQQPPACTGGEVPDRARKATAPTPQNRSVSEDAAALPSGTAPAESPRAESHFPRGTDALQAEQRVFLAAPPAMAAACAQPAKASQQPDIDDQVSLSMSLPDRLLHAVKLAH